MDILNKDYWENRWNSNQTGWDLGGPSPALVKYFECLSNRELRILIPGGGNGYDAVWLWKNGFKNVVLIDVASQPIENFKASNPDFPEAQVICTDFFDLDKRFDLIIEQTFFCALDPHLREQYVSKMHELLVEGRTLAGLLFNFPLTEQGPPFGGSREEYLTLFQDKFDLIKLEECKDSVKPRMGREFFFEVQKLA